MVSILNPGKDEEIIQDFLNEGYRRLTQSNQNLVGETLNFRWIPPPEERESYILSVGGVYVLSRYDHRNGFMVQRAPYRGMESLGNEEKAPNQVYYKELNDYQKRAYIEPKEKRVRPSPPPSLCPEPTDEGNYEISDPENSFLSREDLQRTQVYIVHDNGGRPFKVLAHKNAIEIYVDADELIWDEKRIYNKQLACYTDFLGIWPGYDAADYSPPKPLPKEDQDSDEEEGTCKIRHCLRSEYGQVRRANGNSLLIQLSETKYVHVGAIVYMFETDKPIINYYSPLGNNDVPYPVAYGDDRVYFMCDNQWIYSNQFSTSVDLKGADDMYREFYGHVEGPKKDHHQMKKVDLIHERLW